MSQDWDAEPWVRTGVGEVFGAPRRFAGWNRPALPGGAHICGTPADFANGATFDPDANVQYTQQGLPTCCVFDLGLLLGGDWSPMFGGGVLIGGESIVADLGGVTLGGAFESADVGGLLLGGDWDYVPPFGTSCVDAVVIDLDTDYTRTIVAGTNQWYKIDLTAGTYHIDSSAGGGAGTPVPSVFNGTCPSGLVPVPLSHMLGSGCWEFIVSSLATFWLRWSQFSGSAATTFHVSAGAC